MSLELIYTSVPRGLGPGSSGFCTAAATGGMSRQVVTRLEALSGYQFHFNLSDPRAAENPANYAHTQVRIGAETLSVLSRIAFSGADYSGRTNKIAHHFLLEHGEQSPNGPAWMLMEMARQTFVAGYSGEPRNLPKRDLQTLLATGPRPPEPATTWQSQTGDAGWAGMLVRAFRENPKVPAFVIFAPGQDLLPLFEESLALLPPEERWQVGFATYYTALPAGCQYHWRGIIAGSSAAKEIQRFPNATVIDLTTALGLAPDNMFTQAARTGTVLPPVRAPERPKIQVVERALQPVPLAAEVAREADDLTWATESERDGPAVDPRELAPSPAQLRTLIARARRARWVTPLVAAVILLAVSTLLSTALHFPSLWRSSTEAQTATVAATHALPTQGTASTQQTESPKPPPEAAPPKPAAPSGPGTAPAVDAAAENLGEELATLVGAREAVETAAKEAKSQMEAAGAATNEAKDTLPKGISAANLDDARQKLGIADGAAKKARQAAAESKKQHEEAKRQVAEVEKKADALVARAKGDAKTKKAAQEAKKGAQKAAGEAEQSSRDADRQAREAEALVQKARTEVDTVEARVKAEHARAPKVENALRDRDDPWRGDSAAAPPNAEPVRKLKPDAQEGKKKHFDLACGKTIAFLTLPQAIAGKITFPKTISGDSMELRPTVLAALGEKKLFAICSIAPTRRLTCDLQLSGGRNISPEIVDLEDWLVIEVADVDARRVYKCCLSGPGKRITQSVSLGYDAQGKKSLPPPVSFAHPWPDTLELAVGATSTKPFDASGVSMTCALQDQHDKVHIVIKIESRRQSGGAYELSLSLPTLYDAIAVEVSKVKDDWGLARNGLADIEKQLAEIGKNQERKNELEKQKKSRLDTLRKSEEPVKNLLSAASKAFSKNGKVMVCDAWGVPVVDLKIEFTGEAAAVIEAELAKEKQ
jgi:hypothetical protein